MTVPVTEQYSRIKTFLDRPIAFNPAFVPMTGDVQTALMLSQALYWHSRATSKGNWFYKTQAEWKEEIGMSRCQQETARKKLRAVVAPSGKYLWEEERRGIPAKLFYRINLDALEELLSAEMSDENGDSGKATIKYVGIPHTEENAVGTDGTEQTSVLDCSNQECGAPTSKKDDLTQSITETTTEISSETSERKRELINCSPKKPEARGKKQSVFASRPEATSLSSQLLAANIGRSVNLTASHVESEDLPSAPTRDAPIMDCEFNKCVELLTRPEVDLPIQEARKLAKRARNRFDKLFLHVMGWLRDKDNGSPFGVHAGLFNRVMKDFNEKTLDELDWKQKESELYLTYYPRTYELYVDGSLDNSTPSCSDFVLVTERLPADVETDGPALNYFEKEAEVTRRIDEKEWLTGPKVILAFQRSILYNAIRRGISCDAVCKLIDDANDYAQVLAGIDKLLVET